MRDPLFVVSDRFLFGEDAAEQFFSRPSHISLSILPCLHGFKRSMEHVAELFLGEPEGESGFADFGGGHLLVYSATVSPFLSFMTYRLRPFA